MAIRQRVKHVRRIIATPAPFKMLQRAYNDLQIKGFGPWPIRLASALPATHH